MPLVTILAREIRLKIGSTISRANNGTSRSRKISLKFVEKINVNFQSHISRQYRD